MKQIAWILASDIDNTLTGNPAALKTLAQQIELLREQDKLILFLSTGRSLKEVMDGFAEEHIPQADAIISQVGTEIYLPPFSVDMLPLEEWTHFLHEHYSREQAETFVSDIEGAEIQPEKYNTSLKVSYFLDKAPDPEQAAELIQQRVEEVHNGYQVVWSSGKHLDILPAAAGKGKAIRFLIEYLDLAPQAVITAGDSGNDRSMLLEFRRGIVVGNAQPELMALKGNKHQANLYFAQNNYAAGVAEGLRHYRVIE